MTNQPKEIKVSLTNNGCEFTCRVGDVVRAEIVAVLDANGEPTTLPAIPAWGSDNLKIAVPRQGHEPPGNTWILIDAVGEGECDIYLDAGFGPGPGELIQGRCHLIVQPKAGEVRTVTIKLSINS